MKRIKGLIDIRLWEEKNKKPKIRGEGFLVLVFDFSKAGVLKREEHIFQTEEEAKNFVDSIEDGDVKVYNSENKIILAIKKYAKVKIKDDDNPYT